MASVVSREAYFETGLVPSRYESAFEILQNKRQAQLLAAWGVYLLDALDSGRFASVPGSE